MGLGKVLIQWISDRLYTAVFASRKTSTEAVRPGRANLVARPSQRTVSQKGCPAAACLAELENLRRRKRHFQTFRWIGKKRSLERDSERGSSERSSRQRTREERIG